MNLHETFLKMGEFYAAGLYEAPERSLFFRKSLALRRYLEQTALPDYHGENLYPSGPLPVTMMVQPHFMYVDVDWKRLGQADQALNDQLTADFFRYQPTVPAEHRVAGCMCTHCIPNYERILREGFDGYEARVRQMKDPELREGLLHVLAGIRTYHSRCVRYLTEVGADPALLNAIRRVPMEPCRDFHDAVEAWNFVLYLDNSDNLGSVASGLAPWYRGEDAAPLLDRLYRNLDACNGYSMSLGVRDNPLILPCLKASPGKRRPMIELFVDEHTGPEIWQAALECVLSGNGQPAFYNRKLYLQEFRRRFPQIPEEDLSRLCGGGCTEMMLGGLSNVGSLDAGINLLLLFQRYLDEQLENAPDFETFYQGYLAVVRRTAHEVMTEISNSQRSREKWSPEPMRTLLVDDCIEKERDFYAGGARYEWSIINYAGIVNVIDSLLVVKERIFEARTDTPRDFLEKLHRNAPAFQQELRQSRCRSGIDNDEANRLSARFTATIFGYMAEQKPYLGLAFLPSSIQFLSYGDAGHCIGATPCGRMAGEAVADSLSAILGKDTDGPTAMLKSVTAMDLKAALGTPVVNLTVKKDYPPGILRSLIETYLQLGGMQLQISCLSREELLDACRNPDRHRNLVVRVGGYSEYFTRLSEELKQKVLARTMY